jgi:hypothetical protein
MPSVLSFGSIVKSLEAMKYREGYLSLRFLVVVLWNPHPLGQSFLHEFATGSIVSRIGDIG